MTEIVIDQGALQIGDRVRFTIEATIESAAPFAKPGYWHFSEEEVAAGKIELLHRPSPLKVGDRVRSTDASRISDGEILCILNDQAWVKDYDGLAQTILLSNLERTTA